MICMTESWMALASSSTGREMLALALLARAELMTSLRSCHCWWKKQKRWSFKAGEPHWVPLTLRWRQRGDVEAERAGEFVGFGFWFLRGFMHGYTPAQVIFWNHEVSGRTEAKSLERNELQARSR